SRSGFSRHSSPPQRSGGSSPFAVLAIFARESLTTSASPAATTSAPTPPPHAAPNVASPLVAPPFQAVRAAGAAPKDVSLPSALPSATALRSSQTRATRRFTA